MWKMFLMAIKSSDDKTREKHAVFFLSLSERNNLFSFYRISQASYSIEETAKVSKMINN